MRSEAGLPEYGKFKKGIYLKILAIYAFLLLGALVDFRPAVILGLSLGTAVSLLNLFLLAYRVERIEYFTPAGAVRYMRQGMIIRLSLVALVLVLAAKDPRIDFAAAAIGALTLQIVFYLEIILAFLKRGYQKLQISVAASREEVSKGCRMVEK